MIQKILKIFVAIAIFSNITIALAAKIDHYKVIVNPTKVSVWEAVDLTIKAMDKDENIIKDYEWSVLIMSESDNKAEFPSLEDNSYTFKKSDEWVVKFENAVKFSKSWKQDIHVYDLDDTTNSTFGLAEVEVTDKKIEKNIKIEIISPQNWTTIWKKTITISWKSNKNHQIKIVLNNKKETLTTTNKDWLFEKEIDWLEDWNNSIKAYILDSNWKEIGASKEIIITYDSSKPVFNKLKITPEKDIQTNSKILFEVYATKWLKEVSIVLNEWLNILKEDKPGIYKWEILAPKKEWKYNINVILKNDIWAKVEKDNVKEITVIPEIKSAEETPKIEVKNPKKDNCPKWDYSWNVFDWKCWEKPVDYNAPVDLWIRNLKIVELKTKSVLTWDKLNDAIKYEVYKKTKDWKYELIGTTTKPMYEFPITWDKIKYEYFAVKAIWKKTFVDENNIEQKKEIKWDISQAVKIKTWPQEIFLIILALILGFWVFFIQKRKNI